MFNLKVDNYFNLNNDNLITYNLLNHFIILSVNNNYVSNMLINMIDYKLIFEKFDNKYLLFLWLENKIVPHKKGSLKEILLNPDVNPDFVNSFIPFKVNNDYFIKPKN